MRRAVLVASVVLLSLLSTNIASAQARLASAAAQPETLSPGEPAHVTATLTDSGTPGGAELAFQGLLGGGRHLPDIKAEVPAGATSVSQDIYVPAAYRKSIEYSLGRAGRRPADERRTARDRGGAGRDRWALARQGQRKVSSALTRSGVV